MCLVALWAGMIWHAQDASAKDKAVEFMRRAANSLIMAQRKGAPEAFQTAVRKYGHVPEIGLYALGDYRAGLPRRHRRVYYTGLAKFIGRYAASESPKYPVKRVTFAPIAIRNGRAVMVDSRVYIKGASYYNVRWMLVKSRGVFKIRDAQVLGFWISPFLQTLFQNYIRDNGGQVGALVTALNH